MTTILGKDITVGTKLLWLAENGTYYKETREVIRTVESVTPSDSPWADSTMTFVEDRRWPKGDWFITNDKEYKLSDEFANRGWLDGDPNNPL